jgi:hypothetical protein
MTNCLFDDICPWNEGLPLAPLSLTTPVVEIVQMTAPAGRVVLPVLSRYEVNVIPPELSIVTAQCFHPEAMPMLKTMASQVPASSSCENAGATAVAIKLTPVIFAPLTVFELLVGLKVNPVLLGVMV